MQDLSLNILDIVENSVKAKAKLVKILFEIDGNDLTIQIIDDGIGMDENFLNKVIDPFTTTRTTRKVGMGLPLFKMAAEMAGGKFEITSKLGIGTKVKASFKLDNIDCEPVGDIASTIMTLVSNAENVDYYLLYRIDNRKYEFDTKEVKKELAGVSITESQVLIFIRDMIKENINIINGGRIV